MPVSTQVTDELVARLASITTANGYPFEIVHVEPGRFYEDLPDNAPLPVATLVAAGSGPVSGQQQRASAQRSRQMQVEVVLDLQDYPGRARHELLDSVEWSICKAFGGPYNGRHLAGLVQNLEVGGVEFNYPAPGHSIAVVSATLTVSFIEQYSQP
jgi:acetyl esterase/lipase